MVDLGLHAIASEGLATAAGHAKPCELVQSRAVDKKNAERGCQRCTQRVLA